MTPLPPPSVMTDNEWVLMVNVPVTFALLVMVTTQTPTPAQSPLQPANVEPVLAIAVSVTMVS